MNTIERLNALRADNDSVRAEMLVHSHRFNIKEKTRTVTAFNLFQTPREIAEKMCSFLPEVSPGLKILEPSAGLGALYNVIYGKYGKNAMYDLVENSPECIKELYNKNLHGNLYQRDFLQFDNGYKYDIIFMNPPFKNGEDIKHIDHAKSLLSDNGMLISLCYNGVKQNKKLKPVVDYWEVLPENSFKDSGTRASVCIMTIYGN